MNAESRKFVRVLAALVATLAGPTAAQAGDLEVSVNEPDVQISTRPAGRNFIRLPALTFEFTLNATCPMDYLPESLSLSIADTRISLGAERLATESPVTLTVNVPASQIAPVAVNNFCIDGNDGDDNSKGALSIPSILSAQAALMCANEEERDMTYASESLRVRLRCETQEEADTFSIRR